jgi:hypothetical protein
MALLKPAIATDHREQVISDAVVSERRTGRRPLPSLRVLEAPSGEGPTRILAAAYFRPR